MFAYKIPDGKHQGADRHDSPMASRPAPTIPRRSRRGVVRFRSLSRGLERGVVIEQILGRTTQRRCPCRNWNRGFTWVKRPVKENCGPPGAPGGGGAGTFAAAISDCRPFRVREATLDAVRATLSALAFPRIVRTRPAARRSVQGAASATWPSARVTAASSGHRDRQPRKARQDSNRLREGSEIETARRAAVSSAVPGCVPQFPRRAERTTRTGARWSERRMDRSWARA